MLNILERFLPQQLSENERAQKIIMEKIIKHPDMSEDDIGNLISALKKKQESTTKFNLSPSEIAILRRIIPNSQELDNPTQQAANKLSIILNEQEDMNRQTISLEPPTFSGRLANFKRNLASLDLTSVVGGLSIGGAGVLFAGGGLVGGYETITHLQELGLLAVGTGGISLFSTSMGTFFVMAGKEMTTWRR